MEEFDNLLTNTKFAYLYNRADGYYKLQFMMWAYS